MVTTSHSFMDIFDATFDGVQLKKILIPIIQRDYAQGRKTPEVNRVRDRFLDSLYKAVTEKPITLDFVYGDIDMNGDMIPLDGQQRLTTLFLLHWYAARKDNIPTDEYSFLKKFSYETRYSARDFCTVLVNNLQNIQTVLIAPISEEIANQAWFPLGWKKDPTINSMLVMLDAIELKFKDVSNLWECLKEKCISFYFLPIKDMGLTDDLYIKMNSRGKPLTLFEHFKAALEREIRRIDKTEDLSDRKKETLADRIMRKIDCEWTDLLWKYHKSDGNDSSDDNLIDDKFLHYFKFICDIICYKRGGSTIGRSNDEFDLLQMYFSSDSPNVIENIEIMERFFDCWCDIPGYESPSDFLKSFMSDKHEIGKIVVDKLELDIFKDCLCTYSNKTGRTRLFPLNRLVLLYAITLYLQNRNNISANDFARRIRIVNNLIQNSEDEISDRTDRNRMKAILAQTDSIILKGVINDSIGNNYNLNQLSEEKEKIEFLKSHPKKTGIMFKLEDHFLLKGQISIIGLKNIDYATRFESLFKCDWDCVDRAMMATGDYGQRERNSKRYQYGSSKIFSAWHNLFHRSANSGFDNTKAILISLLKKKEEFSDEILKKIANDYLQECEHNKSYPLRYYYIKYKEYRPGSFGKMHNESHKETPYMFSVLQTRTQLSENSYIPFLKATDNDGSHISRDDLGQRLIFGDKHIVCTNNSYLIKKNDNNKIVDTIDIPQNDQEVDIKDRIVLLKNYIQEKCNSILATET